MKRLKYKLLNMDPKTTTYTEMYEGYMRVIPQDGSPMFEDFDSVYYQDDIGYNIQHTNKLAQDKPSVIINIPVDRIFYSIKSCTHIEKLLNYFTQLESKTVISSIFHCSSELKAYIKMAADFCLREFKSYVECLNAELFNRSRPDKENGKYILYSPTGEVLMRNVTCFAIKRQKDYEYSNGDVVALHRNPIPQKLCLCILIQVQLPYRKLRKAVQMLCRDLPNAVYKFIQQFDCLKLEEALELAEKQVMIREWLKTSEYCAFLANGSILPRLKNTDLPLADAIPFKSPLEDQIEIFGVTGMGIKKGVTVITGGGYSGKTTLIDALSSGIYDHRKGDGRELVITDNTAMTISAEDGRSVKNVDITPFIKWIPGKKAENFSTERASGSTSQAVNVIEAINYGSKLLLIDEDKSATNFMICDNIMKELIKNDPITPFTYRVNELFNIKGVSTILVIGGSGEYLSTANNIYLMNDFTINNITKRAKKLCSEYSKNAEIPKYDEWFHKRTLLSNNFIPYPKGSGTEYLEVFNNEYIFIGDEKIDIRMLHDIVTPAQLTALGFMLRYIEITNIKSKIDVFEIVDKLYDEIEYCGLDKVFSSFFCTCERFLDLPRKFELYSIINRMKTVNFILENG